MGRHQVITKEVEDVCRGKFQVEPTYKGRLKVSGFTRGGRMLTVILAPTGQPGEYFPVTARPANRKERQVYQAAQTEGGEPS